MVRKPGGSGWGKPEGWERSGEAILDVAWAVLGVESVKQTKTMATSVHSLGAKFLSVLEEVLSCSQRVTCVHCVLTRL